MKGKMGRFLFVNLSSREIREEVPDDSIYEDFIGGYGVGVRTIYNSQPSRVDRFGPQNILGFAVGPLTATPAITGKHATRNAVYLSVLQEAALGTSRERPEFLRWF